MSLMMPHWQRSSLRRHVPLAASSGPLLAPFDFDLGQLTFIAGGAAGGLAKRDVLRFAAAPIVQGKWDGTGTGDVLSHVRGAQLFETFYANIDSNQGTGSFWITPEFDGNDGIDHILRIFDTDFFIVKAATDFLQFRCGSGSTVQVNVAAWTAGTTYHIVVRWDSKNTLDGTNYASIHVNGSGTFDITSAFTAITPDATAYIGSNNGLANIDAIIEGERWDRRVWYEATSGTGEPYYFNASGYIDEIAFAYDAGAGADPALVEASWDGCMCLPTDSAVGALVTGTGEAWSHPHASALLNNTWLEDTFGPNQQDVVSFNGTSTLIDCGSAAALDDIPAGGGDITIGVWIKLDAAHSGNEIIVTKGAYITSGWFLYARTDGTIGFYVNCDTTDGSAFTTTAAEPGKWYYIAASYNDTTKAVEIAIDGRWEAADNTVGAYTSDAATSLVIGRRATAALLYFTGDIGNVSIWSDDHHTAGTDFIPPRTKPGAGGALVESWGLDDGTGATAVATVTSPGNDGTIANHTWTEKWEYTGTPLELTSLEFGAAWSHISAGSDGSIDDLPSGGQVTLEGYFLCDPTTLGWLFKKTDFGPAGFDVAVGEVGPGRITATFQCAGINAYSHTNGALLNDSRWHHIAVTYDDTGDRIAHIFVDGVEYTDYSVAGVGAYGVDAAADMQVCQKANLVQMAVGWVRYSDSIRYTNTFVSPSRVNPPANDGNAQLLYNMDEGAGGTVTDSSGNGNTGTMSGTYEWHNTFDQATNSPGSRTYAWGYSISSDGAADGVEQHIAVTAGDDWVLRVPVRYEDATAQARILVYDESNAAAVSTFDGPPRTGLHSGANNSATLTVANEFFPASLIDGIIYNITDSSFGTITAVGGTNQDTITAALGSGGDNDWDTNDVFMLMPPLNWVWAEPFCIEVPAQCTEISVQLLNAAGDGVLHWQQAEVQESLISNGSLEGVYAGVPPIPPGWLDINLDAGDAAQELAIIHSGLSSFQQNPGAVAGEYIRFNILVTQYSFYSISTWYYGDGVNCGLFPSSPSSVSVAHLQHDPALSGFLTDADSTWRNYSGVFRNVHIGTFGLLLQLSGVADTRYIDDVSAIELDDVSLTVTPASQANSLEGTGIRVAGRDQATQVPGVGILQATQGWIRFRWRPRHDAAQAVAFGETGTTDIFDGRAPLANAIQLYWAAANTVQLIVFDGGILGIIWDATGAVVADTEYLVEIRYYPARADLLIDGVVVATGAAGIDFGTDIITLANYGHNNVNADQTDAIFSAP